MSLTSTSGVGKTALVRSIRQSVEDVVHVDPAHASASSRHCVTRESGISSNSVTAQSPPSTLDFLEYYASTRPYPSWWTDIEANKNLKRRNSFGDVVLERNITIVDTPACEEPNEVEDDPQGILLYLHNLARRSIDFNSMNDDELLKILNGRDGAQVDLVLYLISGKLHLTRGEHDS